MPSTGAGAVGGPDRVFQPDRDPDQRRAHRHAGAGDLRADRAGAAEEPDVLHPFVYINYANKGDDVFAGYGEDNKKRLIAIQKNIDPYGIFTSSGLWRGFFKLR